MVYTSQMCNIFKLVTIEKIELIDQYHINYFQMPLKTSIIQLLEFISINATNIVVHNGLKEINRDSYKLELRF